jgi:hypothetical protein
MGVEAAVARRNALLVSAGKRALNIKYPDEFELYVIALELVDESFNTLRYFVFPVNPSSIEESKPQLTNIKKTLGGVTVLKNTTFVPTRINISGSFGRNFKVLLGSTYEDFLSSFVSPVFGFITNKSLLKGVKQIFDDRIKSGYGCCKILEDIIEENKKIGTDGQIRKLIFHNPALGNSYIVEPGELSFKMSEQTNMIWNYSLSFTSVAPLESLLSQQQLQSASKQLVINGYMQGKVNDIVKGISSIVGKGIDIIPSLPF